MDTTYINENWSDRTQQYIQNVHDYLVETGGYQPIYSQQLIFFGDAIELYGAAMKSIQKDGLLLCCTNGSFSPNPSAVIRDRAAKEVQRFCSDFGLSIKALKAFKNVNSKQKSPLGDFLSK